MILGVPDAVAVATKLAAEKFAIGERSSRIHARHQTVEGLEVKGKAGPARSAVRGTSQISEGASSAEHS